MADSYSPGLRVTRELCAQYKFTIGENCSQK